MRAVLRLKCEHVELSRKKSDFILEIEEVVAIKYLKSIKGEFKLIRSNSNKVAEWN